MDSIKNNKIINNLIIRIKQFTAEHLKMKLLVTYLIINLAYILIGSFIFMTGNITDKFHYLEFSYGLRVLLVLNVIVFGAICLKKHYKKNIIHLFIVLIAFFGVISVLFAINQDVALNGYKQRYEGFFSILYYLSILLLSSFVSDKYKKVLVKCILACGVFHAVYAICQVYELFNVRIYEHTYRHFDETLNRVVSNTRIWALGCTTNPNVFGAYMLICISYSMGLFLDNKKIIKKIIYGLLIALFMFGIMISNCMSAVVGLTCVGIYILIYSIKNKLWKELLVIIAIILSIAFLVIKLDKTKLVRDIKRTTDQTVEIAKGNADDSYGTNRIFIWKETLKAIPKYWLHGAGIDNFYYAFDGGPIVYRNMAFDKAHNEYLQVLITQGVFALISYLLLFGFITFKGIKNSFKYKEAYLILPVIGFLVHAFFAFNVIELAPIFYMTLGLCSAKHKSVKFIGAHND